MKIPKAKELLNLLLLPMPDPFDPDYIEAIKQGMACMDYVEKIKRFPHDIDNIPLPRED